MSQSLLAGIILAVIGIALAGCPRLVWKISESWKSKNSDAPSDKFNTVCRAIGSAFLIIGILLASGIMK